VRPAEYQILKCYSAFVVKNCFSQPQIAVSIVDMEIKGKTAIITGATGGLTEAIVLSLAKAGANCICIYHRNSAKSKILKRKLKTKSLFIQTDLTVPKNIENVFAEIRKLNLTHSTSSGRGGLTRFAPPRILINAAAIFGKKPIEDVSFEYIRKILDINFAAAMEMTQKFVELVRGSVRQKQNLSSTAIGEPIAKIINIADITATKPPAGFSIYCASKAALIAATKSLAKELAPDWTVNAVAPGVINWQKNIAAEQKKKILAHIPAGRTGSPDEVAQTVKFLIENDYITGQVINVDGGRSL
jgi:NAD(P)-dependent dehydrogenase (short-subunit alcohol dehydrogenase family)